MNEKWQNSLSMQNHIISLSLYLPFLTGIRAKQISPIEKDKPCIYYANHSSHLDGLVIWSSTCPHIRPFVHPVAAEDYWNKKPFTSLSFSSYLSLQF